jgi:hypothetical protein
LLPTQPRTLKHLNIHAQLDALGFVLNQKASRLFAVILGFAAGLWLLVPLHEFLHAWGCWVTGGHVSHLEISPVFGGEFFARIFPWVSSGGEYAGRLAGFRPAGDLSYLATVLAPFVILCPAGAALARLAAERRSPVLFGFALSAALQPLASLTGDCYEAASIPLTRLASLAGFDGALRLRGDDCFKVAQLAARQHSALAWGLFMAGCFGGILIAIVMLRVSGGVAPRQQPQGASSAPRCTRRLLLRGALGVTFVATGIWILQRVYFPRRLAADEVETVAALLDTLIPDGEFPGARQTGVLASLLPTCESQRQTRRALLEGVHLLDRKARALGARNFVTLDARQRAAVVEECALVAEGTLPRFFYRTVRDRALQLHYSQKLAWKPLRFDHAPQPEGHLDYWQQPHA